MLRCLRSALCAMAIVTVVNAECNDNIDIPPELSFTLSGQNLDWPSDNTRNIHETNGRYIPKNVIGTRTQIYENRAIVAYPRYKPGVPFTLGMVPLENRNIAPNGGAIASPFPSWLIQEEGNCEALQSAVDIALDIQGILWVLDVGIVNTMTQPVRRCPPKIVAIDVKTGKVVQVIPFNNLVSRASRLQHLVVDYANNGKIYLYVSDAATRAIIVYDVTASRGFRAVLPDAAAPSSPNSDILYINLVKMNDGTSVLYFSYLGSSHLYSIRTSKLKRGRIGNSVIEVGPKQNKIVFLGTDNGRTIFFRNKGESDVYMWKAETSFRPENFILVQKGDECRLPTQVVPGYKKFMWVLESNFQDYIDDKVGCAGATVALHPLVGSGDDL